MKRRELHNDIETFCELDLTKVGVYKYSTHESFEITIFAYAFDDDEPTYIDCTNDAYPGESIPVEVWEALTDPNVLKIAHNANFEIVCMTNYYKLDLDPAQWFCTQVAALYLGLPSSLGDIAKALKLEDQKDAKGKALIKYFAMPCKATKVNGGRTRNLPHHDPVKWQQFCNYGAQDVKTEHGILKYIRQYVPMPAIEWIYWQQDQRINGRGIHIDVELVNETLAVWAEVMEEVRQEICDYTGVSNATSLPQLKEWLAGQGFEMESMAKEALQDAIDDEDTPEAVRHLLRLRQLSSRTSASKYSTALKYLCDDGKVYGQIKFYGAGRTGRFAANGIQIHNLKKMLAKELSGKTSEKAHAKIVTAREAVRKHLISILYDDPTDIISQLIRSIFIAGPGNKIVSCDYAAIEARVLGWLAGEDWKLEVFRTHGKIYEATAAKMFGVPIEEIVKGHPLRAKGKVSELALGYQGAKGAMLTMGALREGLTEEELPGLVSIWRKANPNTVTFWREVEDAFKTCFRERRTVKLRKKYTSLTFIYDRGYVFIELPSGRRLAYHGVQLKPGRYGESITYWGIQQEPGKPKIWRQIDTYGGKLVENITQAVARDCLVECMYAMDNDIDIIFHVHDEIVAEEPEETAEDCLRYMQECMSISPIWAPDLPLGGEGYISDFYKKD
jgi:DNA polymerase